jgi:hypothetical protein
MKTIDKIRNRLIDKILSINNSGFLDALDKLISSSSSESDSVTLTTEQKEKLLAFEESIPEWQIEEVKQRLEDYKKNPDQVLDFDSAMDDIEKDI